MEFTADQVWGLAVRADTINEGYLKEPVFETNEEGYPINMDKPLKQPNKQLVKAWLRDNIQPTDEEITKGQEYRRFFNSYTLKALTGQLNDFEQQALKIAQMDVYTGRNLLEFAIVSCLPSVARRDQARTELKREVYASEQLTGREGDAVVGDVTVVSSRYNHNYNKYRVVARMGESFIDFWFNRSLEGEVRIKGKIKNVRADKTTQLNYVKVL